jgi:Domain of unknown function (DUF4184)
VPLTPAHAAVAWPISRVAPRLPLAALVIGSLSPDFEYLLRMAPSGYYSHTWAGVFAFCVPVSMAVWLVFHRFVYSSLLQFLPSGARAEMRSSNHRLDWATCAWAVVATWLGTLTHLGWDAFTHAGGFVVAGFPFLRARVSPLAGLRWYQVLQHGSTVMGMLALLLWGRNAWRRFRPETRAFGPGEAARAARMVLVLLGVSAIVAALNGMRVWGSGLPQVLGYAAVGGMSGLVLATLGLAALDKQQRAKRRRAGDLS